MNTARAESATISFRSSPVASPAPRDPTPESLCGRVLQHRYLPGALLGAGPFGARYLAKDLSRDQTVCLELLPRRALRHWGDIRAALTRVAELGDPNIARLLDYGLIARSWPYLVLERDAARTLSDELATSGAFELGRVVRIGAQCASALAAAHGVGVLHGALTPERIALGAPGRNELARVAGFGLAPLVQSSLDALLGGPPELCGYASPEHACGAPLDASSDIYSLAAVLYALAAGRPVFEGSATGVLRQQRCADPEPPSRRRGARDLAFRAFDKIILRCLAKRPEQRYERAADLAVDLARLDAVLARRQPTPEAGWPAPEEPPRSGPRVAAAPASRTVQRCSPRRPPKPRGRMPALPKVIVQ